MENVSFSLNKAKSSTQKQTDSENELANICSYRLICSYNFA